MTSMRPGSAGDQEECHEEERSRAFIGGFDFVGWEEEEEEEEEERVGGDGNGDGGTSTAREEFIEQSHGENAGSLSPIMSLRRSSSPPRKSASPLRLQRKGQHMCDANDSMHGSNGGAVEDEIQVWRCASDEENNNRSLLETFLFGWNTPQDDSARFSTCSTDITAAE